MMPRLSLLSLALTFTAWTMFALHRGYAITGASGGVAVMGFGMAWVMGVRREVVR